MKIIAHRGASGEFPENSLLAFEQAIKQQADAIELDAHFHLSSGQYIVVHDHLVVTEAGITKSIQDCPIDQLLHRAHTNRQSITRLEDVLQTIAGQLPVNVELKSFGANQATLNDEINALKTLLNDYQTRFHAASSDIVISSFNHQLLAQSAKLLPGYKYGALIAHIPIDVSVLLKGLTVQYLNVDISAVNAELVQAAKSLGLKVQVYTVDNDYDIQRCLQHGVDAIFTNWPAKTRNIISSLTGHNVSY